ncbi:MAG: hypothetical protein R3213_07615 [Flavobacteriaceae bacterium]|nr:hypothetical protein [Flavobacteriaceae bacterium]
MLVNAKTIFKNIDDIVERAYLDFTFLIIGDDFFTEDQKRNIEALGLIIGRRPLIELLYILVRQRSTPGYRKDRTLNQLLDEIAETGVLPVINDTHQYSIEHGKAKINEAIEQSKRDLKSKIKHEILTANNEFKNEIAVERLTAIPAMVEKKEQHSKKLLLALAGIGVAVHSGFLKSFTTAMTDTVNNAAVDSATTARSEKVYKEVISDKSLCPWCDSFYRDKDGMPKVYNLSELQKNGSNSGKPKSQWKPTVGATHPRCRCQLHFVPAGAKPPWSPNQE